MACGNVATSVVATESLRMLVFGEGTLNVLVSQFPAVGDVIREAVQKRLPQR